MDSIATFEKNFANFSLTPSTVPLSDSEKKIPPRSFLHSRGYISNKEHASRNCGSSVRLPRAASRKMEHTSHGRGASPMVEF